MYWEQVGWNLQEGGNRGDTYRLYFLIIQIIGLSISTLQEPYFRGESRLPSFRNERRNSSRNSSKLASAEDGRADTTMSKPGALVASMRKISLSRRRTVLRVTALPTFLETDNPSLAVSRSFGKAWTEKSLHL